MNNRNIIILETPFGFIKVLFTDEVLLKVQWTGRTYNKESTEMNCKSPLALQIVKEFSEYWAGKRRAFSLPYALSDNVPFYKRVWKEIESIPYGETVSYKDLANRIVKGGCAARAVGQACAKNPLPIVIPCHRVVRSDGSVGHYSAEGGTLLKAQLINFERQHLKILS